MCVIYVVDEVTEYVCDWCWWSTWLCCVIYVVDEVTDYVCDLCCWWSSWVCCVIYVVDEVAEYVCDLCCWWVRLVWYVICVVGEAWPWVTWSRVRITNFWFVTRSRVPSTLSRSGVMLCSNVTSVDPALGELKILL